MSNVICVNIWDDYHDDGYVPEGETQKTYAYVECKLTDPECKDVLALLREQIEQAAKPEWNLQLALEYYESAKKYPNLVGTEHAWCLYNRWQLEIKNLSHENREHLMDTFKDQELSYMNKPIEIISES